MGPRRPPKTNVGTETASDTTIASIFKKVNVSEVRDQLIRSNSRIFQLHWSTCSAWGISSQKEPFPRSEFTLALNLDIPDVGWSPNAVRDHVGTAQVDFEDDRPSPADSPPADLLITMVKETVILYKKEFRKMKKCETFSSLSLIWKWWKRYWLRDCPWLCQSCKRGYVYIKTFARGFIGLYIQLIKTPSHSPIGINSF